MRALTDGVGADVALDCAGDSSEGAVLRAARGRVVQVGLPLGGTAPLIMARVAREIEIVGSHGMAARDFLEVLRLVVQGKRRPQGRSRARRGWRRRARHHGDGQGARWA